MTPKNHFATLLLGIGFGAAGTWFVFCSPRPAIAANDRQEGFVICTGAAGVTPRSQLDGVWLLDHKQGRLLATIVDRATGQTVGFANLDLLKEFELGPSQSVNFLMTTGHIAAGQAALYLVETTSSKFGVYTLGPASGGAGVSIMRHDITSFRKTGN